MDTKNIFVAVGLITMSAQAAAADASSAIDTYIRPYVESNNFSGNILVRKNAEVLFDKSYGLADREQKTPNTKSTRFHIASVSMQFTAAAVLRLLDDGKLTLDSSAGEFLPKTPAAEKITVRDLLVERSGLSDINDLPGYDKLLQHHQTPSSLVAKISGEPLLFEPGSKFLHEEHSAYNLLALIVERKTGLPFADAMKKLVFQPMRLDNSFVDDDSEGGAKEVSHGYQPVGVSDLQSAPTLHWSAKTGNASVCTTAEDEDRWLDGLFRNHSLGEAAVDIISNAPEGIGYGWFHRASKRFKEVAFYMNGRAPGFASFVLYLPNEKLTVVAMSNIYSSATTDIGYDIAAIALGLPYDVFQPAKALSSGDIKACTGSFQFGPDFYQKNAKIELTAIGNGLCLRWPSGDLSPLIPVGQDRFIDRNYWEPVKIERDSSGKQSALVYDRFRGLSTE
jgi:CubicO group peptidase (beta-lactamase class C family)